MKIRNVIHRGLRRFIERDDPSGLKAPGASPSPATGDRRSGSTPQRARLSISITRTTT